LQKQLGAIAKWVYDQSLLALDHAIQAPTAERDVSSRLQKERGAHMSKASILSHSITYRRKAATCRGLAACAKSAVDREQLLVMSRSWLARADSEDWRDGLPPLPPVHSNALAIVRAY
jgi:hypothetical protein